MFHSFLIALNQKWGQLIHFKSYGKWWHFRPNFSQVNSHVSVKVCDITLSVSSGILVWWSSKWWKNGHSWSLSSCELLQRKALSLRFYRFCYVERALGGKGKNHLFLETVLTKNISLMTVSPKATVLQLLSCLTNRMVAILLAASSWTGRAKTACTDRLGWIRSGH